MADTIRGDQFKYVGTVGSVVISDIATVLRRVILPGTFVGSVEFYDSATVAGTNATNQIHVQGIPLLRQYDSYEINARCKNGLVYVAIGTPTLTFTWD